MAVCSSGKHLLTDPCKSVARKISQGSYNVESTEGVNFSFFLAEENNMFSVETSIDPDLNVFQSYYLE